MPEKFKKRHYRSWRQFWSDVVYPFHHRNEIKAAMKGNLVSPAFRERLMMAVTAVTGCRFCAYYHAGEALKAGLSESEVRSFLDGNLESAPTDELPALLYAQHWAEAEANPDPEIRQKLIDTYGAERSAAMDLLLRLILTGNLMGNTWDYLLYRLSFKRWRGHEARSI